MLCRVGGPAANAAVTAELLGSEVTLVTAVGTSALTDLAAARLGEGGVAVVDLLAGSSGMPAISTVLVAADSGDRAVVSMNATAVDAVTDVPADALDTASVLLVDGHHIETAIPAAAAARRRGVPVLHGALAHYMAGSYRGPASVPSLVRAASVVATASVGTVGARGWRNDLDGVVAAARRALDA